MIRFSTFVFSMAVALAVAACKKEDKPADGGKQPAAEQPVKPEPGAGSGSGTGSGSGSGTAAVVDPGAGAASGTAAPAAGDTLTVVVRAPAVGLKVTRTETSAINLKLTAGGQVIDSAEAETKTTHTEVLAVADNATTKTKVHYETRSKQRTTAGKVSEEPQPLQGKTFVLSSVGGAATAVRLDGDAEVPVTPEEQDALKRSLDQLGKVPGIVQVLAQQPWKKGEQVPLSPAALALIVSDLANDMTVKAGSLTFLGAAGDVATFQYTVDGALKGDLAMTMNMQFTLDTARTLPLELSLTGTIMGTMQTPKGPIGTDGTVSGKTSHTYQ